MNKLFLLISFPFLILTYEGRSKDYYFSNSGNDSTNTGLSSYSPYKTISKLNSLYLAPGDNVYFKRGEIFFGQINIHNSGTSSKYINFDAYGSGANPIIKGSYPIEDWQNLNNKTYAADVSNLDVNIINQLFVNGKLMTIARYPNSGFLLINSSSKESTIYSESLKGSNQGWNEATAVIRTERWVYENRTISRSDNESISFSYPTDYSLKPGYGFFITNHFNALDSLGEWFFDRNTKKIYLIPPTNENPEQTEIEVSIVDYGFFINNQNYISINNLNIRNQKLDGIFVNGCNHISIANNQFSNCGKDGIHTGDTSSSQISIHNNILQDIPNNGIDIIHASFCNIKGNTLKRIAMKAGLGESGDGKYIGILAGTDSYIAYNILDSIGYNGIHGQSRDSILFNYINHTCLTKDDGGGIYFYKSDHLVIKNNIVLNSIGNNESTSDKFVTYAHGIYLDDSSSYCNISSNSIINGDFGIFVHNSFNNTLDKNILYNNRKSQLAFQSDHQSPEEVNIKENNVTNNICYGLHPDQLCLYIWTFKNTYNDFGTFDHNYYCNPYTEILFKTTTVPGYPIGTIQKIQAYNFLTWNLAFPLEKNPIIGKVNFNPYYSIQNQSDNLISNSDFENGITDWYNWGTGNFTISIDSSNTEMIGNSLKCTFPKFNHDLDGYLATGGLEVAEGKYYKLSFRANSINIAGLNFDLTQNEHPFESLISQNSGSFLIQKKATDFEYIFKCIKSYSNARIMFYTTGYDSTLWIDNVRLIQVSVDTNTSTPGIKSPIYINPTIGTKSFTLPGRYTDLNGYYIRRTSISPFSSKIFIKTATTKSYFSNPLQKEALSNDEVTNQILIYSLPATKGDLLNIQFPLPLDTKVISYSIYDISGKEIIREIKNCNQLNEIQIDTACLDSGIYLIKLLNEGNVKMARLVIN